MKFILTLLLISSIVLYVDTYRIKNLASLEVRICYSIDSLESTSDLVVANSLSTLDSISKGISYSINKRPFPWFFYGERRIINTLEYHSFMVDIYVPRYYKFVNYIIDGKFNYAFSKLILSYTSIFISVCILISFLTYLLILRLRKGFLNLIQPAIILILITNSTLTLIAQHDDYNLRLKNVINKREVFNVKWKNKNYKIFKWHPSSDRKLNIISSLHSGSISNSLKAIYDSLNKSGNNVHFVCNAGMFTKTFKPKGLLINQGKIISNLDLSKGDGNFYLHPNGVFFQDSFGCPGLLTSQQAKEKLPSMLYATQSGPMLLTNNTINCNFSVNSQNLNIRNAVGIDANDNVFFILSDNECSFYELATLFKKLKCINALYLDGFISKAIIPALNIHQDLSCGPVIAIYSKS